MADSLMPPGQVRIIGDGRALPEAFIPITPRTLAIARDLMHPTLESRARRRAEAEAREAELKAKREAEAAAGTARHAELLGQYAASPILLALLHAHAPVIHPGHRYMECHGCPSYYVTEYDVTDYPEWPCPTWSVISEGA